MTTPTESLQQEPKPGGEGPSSTKSAHARADKGAAEARKAPAGAEKSASGATTVPQHPYEDEARNLLASRMRPTAAHGWRKVIANITGGRINPGPSPQQQHAAELISRIKATLDDVHKVAFVSAKGGVGKSTMTVAVGNAIARIRGDRVIAVDVDPDLGDLSARFSERGGPEANIEQVAALQNVERYARVRVHTVLNNDRLELLSAQNNPKASYTLGPDDYSATMRILERHCNVILLDCGTSVTHPLFSTIAGDVTGLVVVASQDVRGVEGALSTLDWLYAHGFEQVLSKTVVVLNATRGGRALVDLKVAENELGKFVSEVFRVPYDLHLAQGVAVDFNAMKSRTRKAVLELAGGIAQHYSSSQVRPYHEDDLGAWIDMIR